MREVIKLKRIKKSADKENGDTTGTADYSWYLSDKMNRARNQVLHRSGEGWGWENGGIWKLAGNWAGRDSGVEQQLMQSFWEVSFLSEKKRTKRRSKKWGVEIVIQRISSQETWGKWFSLKSMKKCRAE